MRAEPFCVQHGTEDPTRNRRGKGKKTDNSCELEYPSRPRSQATRAPSSPTFCDDIRNQNKENPKTTLG